MVWLRQIGAMALAAAVAWQMGAASSSGAERASAPYLAWDANSMPIVFYVNSDDAALWPEGAGAIVRSFMSWERIPGTHVRFQFAGTTDKRKAQNDGENIVTWVREGWQYGSDTVAFAVLWVSPEAGRIVGMDVLLNAQDFTWATDGNPQAMDVQDVTTHESGHALGLEHSVTSTAVTMFPVIVPGETRKRLISEEERWVLQSVYPCGRTRVDTYALSEASEGFRPEREVVDYPPVQGEGKIFLVTRVDGDGDGLDEIGTIQEENGRLAFYLFSAVDSHALSEEALAYDAWSIPEGNNLLDMTALDMDGDGRQEIGVLRGETDGTFALYVYDTPAPFSATGQDARPWVRREAFALSGGDNVVAVVGADYNGDGVDEVGAVRLTPQGNYFLDVHVVGQKEGEPSSLLASIPLPGIMGFTDLDALDIKGDGKPELMVLFKDSRGWYISAFELPDMSELTSGGAATLLSALPIAVPAGRRPMRMSAVRIADSEGEARPAICVLMGESI
jgi:hypothetical protein